MRLICRNGAPAGTAFSIFEFERFTTRISLNCA
jgi:hypothetical protein